MDKLAFSVFDSKAKTYLNPFFANSRGEAIRSFMDCARDPQHMFCRHAGDFTLVEIGMFDDFTCNFMTLPAPDIIGTAQQFQAERLTPLEEAIAANTLDPDSDINREAATNGA